MGGIVRTKGSGLQPQFVGLRLLAVTSHQTSAETSAVRDTANAAALQEADFASTHMANCDDPNGRVGQKDCARRCRLVIGQWVRLTAWTTPRASKAKPLSVPNDARGVAHAVKRANLSADGAGVMSGSDFRRCVTDPTVRRRSICLPFWTFSFAPWGR